jgi:DNA-directed RNA polymerase specialized sigma24 family protein
LTDLQDKTNAFEFAKKQEIPIGYVEELFMLVLEEKKGIASIKVGGDVYIDEAVFAEWYTRREKAEELRSARKEARALGHLLEDENAPDAEEKFNEETDESPSFTREGGAPENSEQIKDEDSISDDERELMRQYLLIHQDDAEEVERSDFEWQQMMNALEMMKFSSPRDAQLLEMRYIENIPDDEIGKVMGLTVNSVRNMMRSARNELELVVLKEAGKMGEEKSIEFERQLFLTFLTRQRLNVWSRVIVFKRDADESLVQHSGFDHFYALMKEQVDALFAELKRVSVGTIPVPALRKMRHILAVESTQFINDICYTYANEIREGGRRQIQPAKLFEPFRERVLAAAKGGA